MAVEIDLINDQGEVAKNIYFIAPGHSFVFTDTSNGPQDKSEYVEVRCDESDFGFEILRYSAFDYPEEDGLLRGVLRNLRSTDTTHDHGYAGHGEKLFPFVGRNKRSGSLVLRHVCTPELAQRLKTDDSLLENVNEAYQKKIIPN